MLLGFRPSQAFKVLVLFSDGALGPTLEGCSPAPAVLATPCVGSPWRVVCVSSLPQGFSLPRSPESPGSPELHQEATLVHMAINDAS